MAGEAESMDCDLQGRQTFGPDPATFNLPTSSFSGPDRDAAALALSSLDETLIHHCLQIARSSNYLDLRGLNGVGLSWRQYVAVFSLRHDTNENIHRRLIDARAVCT